MMNLDDLYKRRRSVRHYDAEATVTAEDIRHIIAAAQQAPSWKNQQTSRYHVALSPQAREAVHNSLPEKNQHSTQGCSAYIVTSFVPGIVGYTAEGHACNEMGDGWGCYDLGLSNMCLLLKAADMGYDTLIMGLRNARMLHQALDIPDNEVIMAVIALGHRASEPEYRPRVPLDDILTIE